jgi:hypothetical protein
MPCLAATAPPLPPLPAGITFTPFVPPVLPNIGLCCKLPLPTIPIPVPTIPIALPAPVVAAYMAFRKAVQAWFDSLVVECPIQ